MSAAKGVTQSGQVWEEVVSAAAHVTSSWTSDRCWVPGTAWATAGTAFQKPKRQEEEEGGRPRVKVTLTLTMPPSVLSTSCFRRSKPRQLKPRRLLLQHDTTFVHPAVMPTPQFCFRDGIKSGEHFLSAHLLRGYPPVECFELHLILSVQPRTAFASRGFFH